VTKRDMRLKTNKQHLGTASNRDTYEQQKSVVVSESSNKQQAKKEGK
jgi:hypothetical protein